MSSNNEYQRELAKALIEEKDYASAYEIAKQYGWEGVMEQIRYMSRIGNSSPLRRAKERTANS